MDEKCCRHLDSHIVVLNVLFYTGVLRFYERFRSCRYHDARCNVRYDLPRSMSLLTEILAEGVVMQHKTHQPDYGPTEYELDFNFDVDFSLSDYFLIGAYFVFVLPAITLLHAVQSLFRT